MSHHGHGVSDYLRLDCLLNSLFKFVTGKMPKLCTTDSLWEHYSDVIMGTMASQITSFTSVYSSVDSGADQRKHQSSASLAFVWGIPVNSPHKWPVTRKMLPSSWKITGDQWRAWHHPRDTLTDGPVLLGFVWAPASIHSKNGISVFISLILLIAHVYKMWKNPVSYCFWSCLAWNFLSKYDYTI